ncbi:LIM-domain-containing protein [Piromyces finnis]|uniref:LIM-domain-containing protein n=1 Tax=Piromyces finnis TaxID=1754191 RepID=A0A1Y1V6X7_9FUNG|nr:LIM-domain-containing protein [Piromyces finnis]|eukprot:ORX47904.1 LIM-domain-containing protein [Piromyces finnis]
MIGQNFYHVDHVQCRKCGKVLDQSKILELGDDIYCEVCFESECDLGKNRCGYCNEEIFGDLYIKALDKVWHPNHFFCSYCGCKFSEEQPFFEIDGKPYCEEDYSRLFSKICQGCNEVIDEDFMSAMDMHWHTKCFKCHVCDKSLCDEAFYCIDCELYCEFHYQEKENLLCAHCNKPVDKRYVFALNKRWHPNHFFCDFCKTVLYTNSGFKEYKDKPYCKECYIRLYG